MSKHKQLIIICLLALIVTQVSIPEVGATAPGTRVRIEPADLVVGLNETFVVQVMIKEAGDLGAFQLDLTYDSSIVQVTEATLGEFLGSTGRNAIPVGPQINNEAGTVAFGAFSFGEAPAPDGSGVLATISFSPQAEGESDLHLQDVKVTNTAVEVIPVELQDGHVTVLE